ncbi:MAG TPA: phenylalanine--tRNA ligase subunit beta [Pyrinomonadaceae bacterium]|nr:phenylalanine--tRNA ligase subunit beta [Pyrinomonadaceae bacterium]
MFISYNWLRELTGTSMSPSELRERLTMVGLAIDAVEQNNGDYVLDVEVPSNRPDCLSHVGIAREVVTIEGGNVSHPSGIPARVQGRSEQFTSVEIRDPDLCPRYAGRVVRGVRIGTSPAWLVKRLEEIGQRPINNVADITNYVLHELGQPLHAFDLAKLTEQRIVVRRATAGETLKTLDGIDRKLDPAMLVIADAERPVALAGIMGGEDSEISLATADVLIESAYFDPDSVRQTARKLGMDTEASRRFERGADRENVLRAQTRCVELICEIAGGTATEDAVDVYPYPWSPRKVAFRPARVESLTSLRVDEAEMKRVLEALGFKAESGTDDGQSYVVPSWRVDVALEEDLVEEIARHSGYDKIGSELPPATMSGEYQPTEMHRRQLRRALSASGFDEAINFSFIATEYDDQVELLPKLVATDAESPFVSLENPIIENVVRMRPTLISGLLQSLRHNLNHGIRDVRLFEIGRIFANADKDALPNEREALSLIATGGNVEADRAQSTRETDFYDLKGALEAAVAATNRGPLRFVKAPVQHLRDGQSARILLPDGTHIGSLGRLAETIADLYKFRQPVYVAELDLTSLLAVAENPVQYKPLPRYPSVVRDSTLLVDRNVSLQELLLAIEGERIADCRGAQLVGTYEGAKIPEGKRAVTLRIEYRSDERTLRDEEVEERQRQLIDKVLEKFGAELH